ncbi:hypothetical protein QM806_04450 [Rhodococcus sp. IEGM 1351]|uniref:hypothetical protein n=1 Tax=Rhodococcus sp. IEGM 1351 TaxID=3047089 RepID=UPI0024B680CB|nr:hypothetical protein [Rhodococcus sp. IEGM 1351]MDI9934705.1 hypothetical protein [Rhodococcus sp. IEGM 1351]
MSNIYHESNEVKRGLISGDIPKGSIINVQWPSGNSEAVRVHGWDMKEGAMIGCSMGWDNAATEWYRLSRAVVSLIEKASVEEIIS